MNKQEHDITPLYFKDGIQFASNYIRIVHGDRGKYIELNKSQILIQLKSKFNQQLPDKVSNEQFFYYWLMPIDRTEKIYWQIKTVNYADYKPGLYYISPSLLQSF